MSENEAKLCSCGFTQSNPVPHEHDQTVREATMVKHFNSRMRDLLKQRKDLLTACKALKDRLEYYHATHKNLCLFGQDCPETIALNLGQAAIEKATT